MEYLHILWCIGLKDSLLRGGTTIRFPYEPSGYIYGICNLCWWTLMALSISLLIVIIDSTVVNVALPTLQRELDASASELQ